MSIAEKKERIRQEFSELVIDNYVEHHKDERLAVKGITDDTYTKTIVLIVGTVKEVANKGMFMWVLAHAERQMLVKRWLFGKLQHHICRTTVKGFNIYKLVLDE